MRDCRARRSTSSRADRGRVFTIAVALTGLAVGALGPRIAEQGREVVADFAPQWFPADALAAEDDAAAAALIAAGQGRSAPMSFPRTAPALRAALDDASSPAAISELLDRLGIVGDATDVDRLERYADSRTVQVRTSAFTALGRLGDDRALELLMTYVHSPDPGIAQPAITALGRSDSDRAMRELRRLASDPDPNRRQTAWRGLALRGGAEARAVLHRVARTCTPQESWAALFAVAALGEVVDQRLLLDIAKSGMQQKASMALSVLGSFPAVGITDALIELATSGPSHRRGEVLAALGALDDPRVVPVLESAARGHRNERNPAIHALGRSRAPGAFEALVGVADEAGANEVGPAAAALVARPEPEAREILREMAGDDTPLGQAALSALANANDPEATALMIAAFDERGAPPPLSALNHLAIHGGDEGWSLLEEILASGDANSRNAVVWALQQRGDEDAADRLLDLARNGDRNLASTAMGSLEQMGEHARDGLRKLLMERVSQGTDADFGQSVQALARLGGDEVLDLLTARLRDGTAQEKQTAIGALGQMGDSAATAAVAQVFRESDDPSVRVQALNQLLWSNEADDDLLDAAMADDDPTIVAAVASSLAQRGDESANSRLLELAESEDASVRVAALSSLAQVGGQGSERVLLAGLQDPDVAPSIMWTVNSSSSPEVREALRDVARTGEPTLRSSAISALSMDSDPSTMELLVDALGDEDRTIAESALYALQSRGSSSAAEAIAEMMDELPDDEVEYGLRRRAATALQAIGGPAARDRAELIEHVLTPTAVEDDGSLFGLEEAVLFSAELEDFDIR